MQHLRINFGGIWRFELGFYFVFFRFFCLTNLGWFLKSPVATLPLMLMLK